MEFEHHLFTTQNKKQGGTLRLSLWEGERELTQAEFMKRLRETELHM